jgi:hypothetical protein
VDPSLGKEHAYVKSSPDIDSPSLELRAPTAACMRLRFRWRIDRYTHQLEGAEGRVDSPYLVSREGSDRDAWPPSPPLQQLTCQEGSVGPCILLVGMAGGSHWSLSVEQRPSMLVCDAACRLQQQPKFLGSSYQALSPAHWVPDGRRSVACEVGDRRLVVEADLEDTEVTVEDDRRELVIVPGQHIDKLPVTVRWRYLLRFE